MGRFGLLIVGVLWFSGGVSAQDRTYHSQWYYYGHWPHHLHMPGHHGGWQHHKLHKKTPHATAISDPEAIDLLRQLLERLERGQGQRPGPSALERARAEVHAAEGHLAKARANLAHLEKSHVALPRMIVRPQPPAVPAPTDLEQRLDRLQREIEELRRDLRKGREE